LRKTLVLVLLCFGACAQPRMLASQRIVSTPVPAPLPTAPPLLTPDPTPGAPAANVTRRAAPQRVLAAPPETVGAFRGLGSWIDVFDHTDDPATVVPLVRDMASNGVQTLYLESARFGSPADIQFPTAMGAALDEAKSLGMRVVAWYPPAFKDPELDFRRSMTAINYVSPNGNRFDAFGADIEYTEGVPDHSTRSRLAVEYSQRLRTTVGAGYPLAAIVIPPTSLEYNKKRWPGFPWAALRDFYDVFMPMNYWTARSKDPATAANLTQQNAEQVRALTGRPVHVIGGLGESADEAQVGAYVAAAREGGSLGGGLYDFTTTRPEVWDELQILRE
jgi:hypothetical protein